MSFTCRRLSRWQVGTHWVSCCVLNEPTELLTSVTAVYSPMEAPVTVEWDYVKALLHVCPQIRLSTDRFSCRAAAGTVSDTEFDRFRMSQPV